MARFLTEIGGGASDEQPALLVVVGGQSLETAVVELLVDGELTRRLEIDLDGSGMLVASLPHSLLVGSEVRFRVTAPLLGALELDSTSDSGVQASPDRDT